MHNPSLQICLIYFFYLHVNPLAQLEREDGWRKNISNHSILSYCVHQLLWVANCYGISIRLSLWQPIISIQSQWQRHDFLQSTFYLEVIQEPNRTIPVSLSWPCIKWGTRSGRLLTQSTIVVSWPSWYRPTALRPWDSDTFLSDIVILSGILVLFMATGRRKRYFWKV